MFSNMSIRRFSVGFVVIAAIASLTLALTILSTFPHLSPGLWLLVRASPGNPSIQRLLQVIVFSFLVDCILCSQLSVALRGS